ncbi:MAG: PD40 domain-containing protein [Bacteroidales bacterium]|nr:PD40 domain-containing protein [Bacteroidales bacterium]
MRKIILISIILLIPLFLFSQTTTKNKKSKKYFEEAVLAFTLGDTSRAIEYCDKSIEKDQRYTEPYVLKAQILFQNRYIDKAVILLKKVLEIDANHVQIYFILGYYLFNSEDYIESKKYFIEYQQRESDKKNIAEAQKYLKIINFRLKALENPVQFKPVKFSSNINTTAKEYFPTISADNSSIVFTRLIGKTGNERQEDIYISYINGTTIEPAVIVSPLINTQNNEGAHTLSADGKTMIFTRCVPNGSCDLFIAKKDERGNWLIPEKLPSSVNSRYWDTQPSLAADGKTLYFTSNRPGGKGKMDIWVTKYLGNDNWTKPQNLGDSINSPENEMSPFIHFDSKTLYFTSDYYPGMGKFDLFYSKKINDSTWSGAVNLGYPINTSENEYRLVVDAWGDKAYFSSERDTVFQQDIYYFDFPEKLRPIRTLLVRANIFSSVNLKQIKADIITIIDLNTYDTVFFAETEKQFTVCLPYQGEYALNILKSGYMFYSQNFTLDNLADTVRYYDLSIYLKPIVEGEKINLKNTFFETDSYNINPKSYVELNKLVDFLKLNLNVQIQVAGHTDNIGSSDYNLKLSKNRAESIRNYLIDKEIQPNRISSIGYGYTKPIADNQTEEGRKLNRRTEIIILKK